MSAIIAVFGSATVSQDSAEARCAHEVGRRLAGRGAAVMNGGYGGVMEAVSRGAREAGGKVVGVTVDLFADRSPNPHLTVEHPAPDLIERLRVLTEEPDGFLALSGGIGTATELFLVWNLLYLGWRREAPLVVLGDGLEAMLDPAGRRTGIQAEAYQLIQFAKDPETAVELVMSGVKIPGATRSNGGQRP